MALVKLSLPYPCLRPLACASQHRRPESASSGNMSRRYYIPATLEENISQARLACKDALKDGQKRLQLEMPLPLIGATDLDDWPGGIQQQFKAAAPLVSSLLSGLVPPEANPENEFETYIMDQGDAVGVWESEKVALVLFPTADSLPDIQGLVSNIHQHRPLLLMNPQWRGGQVISDFGFGAGKKTKQEFVDSFRVVYHLQQLRLSGEIVQLFKRYPGQWQIAIRDAAGESECVAVEAERPSYTRLQEAVRQAKGSASAGTGWFTRLVQELRFNAESMKRDSE